MSCPLYPQKQTCAVQRPMSAKGQKRTHAAQQIRSLFNHFISAGEQRWRHCKGERLRSLEVENRLELGRCLYRQGGRLLALENAIDVSSRAPVLVDVISPIGNQAAGGDEGAFLVDLGQFGSGRQRNDEIAMTGRKPTRGQNQTTIWGARECADSTLDLASVAHIDWVDLHPERRRHRLDCAKQAESSGYGGIANHF